MKHNRILQAAGRARFALSERIMPCLAHLMLVMVLNLPEQCSFQDLLFHLLFTPKSAEKPASRMDISLDQKGEEPSSVVESGICGGAS